MRESCSVARVMWVIDEAASDAPNVRQSWLVSCLGRYVSELVAAEWVPVGSGQVAAFYCGKLSWKGQANPETVL